MYVTFTHDSFGNTKSFCIPINDGDRLQTLVHKALSCTHGEGDLESIVATAVVSSGDIPRYVTSRSKDGDVSVTYLDGLPESFMSENLLSALTKDQQYETDHSVFERILHTKGKRLVCPGSLSFSNKEIGNDTAVGIFPSNYKQSIIDYIYRQGACISGSTMTKLMAPMRISERITPGNINIFCKDFKFVRGFLDIIALDLLSNSFKVEITCCDELWSIKVTFSDKTCYNFVVSEKYKTFDKTVDQLKEQFDLSCCMVFTDGLKLVYCNDVEDGICMTMHINSSLYAEGPEQNTLMRRKKYTSRGFVDVKCLMSSV